MNRKSIGLKRAGERRTGLEQRVSAERLRDLLESLGYTVTIGERGILGKFVSIVSGDQVISISIATVVEVQELPEDREVVFDALRIRTAPPGREPGLETVFVFNEDGVVRIDKPSESWLTVLQFQ